MSLATIEREIDQAEAAWIEHVRDLQTACLLVSIVLADANRNKTRRLKVLRMARNRIKALIRIHETWLAELERMRADYSSGLIRTDDDPEPLYH
ncbi:hypothetical protein [Bosea sp. 2RAB26]|uniref:hypothetical protein n=1 Tax=Bosea sp. 2RAB26 TaxID=3237476 RepID=UPI003F90326A